MAVTLTVEDDLVPFAPNIDATKAEIMIVDALALAARAAPCILDDDFAYEDAAKAIIRGAILRWNDSVAGAAVTQLVAGPQQITFAPEPRKSLLWPSENAALARLCSDASSRTAYMVDTLPPDEVEGS